MTTTLTVPAALEEIVLRYDAKEEPFTVFDISGELKGARYLLRNMEQGPRVRLRPSE